MNKWIIIILVVLTASCKDNREVWLKEYQNTKCTWAKKEAEFKEDSILSIKKLSIDLISINKEINKFNKPIQSEIELLNHKIGQIIIKYLKVSHRISDEQERINGHNSDPEYESRMTQNDKKNNREVLALENKITVLQSELKENKTYQNLILKQKQIKEQIAKTTATIKEKYAITIDSLKKILVSQNRHFRMILQNSNSTKKENFKSQREKTNLNPCK